MTARLQKARLWRRMLHGEVAFGGTLCVDVSRRCNLHSLTGCVIASPTTC